MPVLAKARSKARVATVEVWTQELGAFWGGAIKGSSPLQAALCRAVLDAEGRGLHVASGALLLDLKTFCDTISLALLMELAVEVRFPPAV
eukprot:1309622-Pyramimonas_sp.AAC.1